MPRAQLVSNLVVAVFGLLTLALGIWALIDPSSFFDNIADWPPYNRHFIHDIGAFQVGLGTVLLFALIWQGDAVLAALGGAAIGGTLHWIAHITDEELGGRDLDPYLLGIVALILVLTFVWRLFAGKDELRRY
ncbi:MAG: hypothetical protein IIC25_03600 [Chloroflexi bacterium]|nr:hypothetical protein [Chloroflexota bacterium]